MQAEIESLSHDGRGIAHIDGKTVFITGALVGETVLFHYLARQRRFDEGVVSEVITPATERVAAQCAHFGVCGGCSLQHMHPDAQIAHKQAMLLEQFTHIGNVQPETIMPPLRGDVWGYRRKARLGVRYVVKKGGVLVGFREMRSGFLADMQSCAILDPRVGHRLPALRALLSQLDNKAYIAQIEVGIDAERAALVLRNLRPLSQADLSTLTQFATDHPDIFLYLQPNGIDSVTPLYPIDAPVTSLRYTLPSEAVHFDFQAHDFTQVNQSINQQMVPQALTWLALQAEDTVLDLFCGLGNFTLPLARRSQHVVGVEGDEILLQRAAANAHRQGIDNIEYHVADLAQVSLPASWLLKSYAKVLLDPPRSGALDIIRQLNYTQTQRIVYVSCNPATLARDAGELVHQYGFRLLQAGVMDMFPHTSHVESMALFTR